MAARNRSRFENRSYMGAIHGSRFIRSRFENRSYMGAIHGSRFENRSCKGAIQPVGAGLGPRTHKKTHPHCGGDGFLVS